MGVAIGVVHSSHGTTLGGEPFGGSIRMGGAMGGEWVEL